MTDSLGVLLDILQKIGALAGLLTAWSYFRDRWTQGYPIVVIDRDRGLSSGRALPVLRIKNRSDRPILIDLPGGNVPDGHFKVAHNSSTYGIVKAVVSGGTTVLDAKEEAAYLLLQPVDFDGLDEESYMHAVVFWRYAQPVLWKKRRKHTAAIRKADYRLLFDDQSGLQDGD